jgi:hypothetical protein
MRCLVGIEKLCCGKNLAQAFAEAAFTSSDSPGDSDRRHNDRQHIVANTSGFAMPEISV